MRVVLPLVLAFVMAGAVEAQDVPRQAGVAELTESAQRVGAYQPKPALEAAPRLQPVPVRSGEAGTEARRYAERAGDASAVAQAPGSTNWWWLVAAIVVGGLIVVAIT